MSTILDVRNLKKYYPIRKGLWRRKRGDVRAVDGVDFQCGTGETLGLAGESGCGKTTLGRCVLKTVPPTEGDIFFGAEMVNLGPLDRHEMKPFRRRMQMVFQDPNSSLNPRMTVSDIVGEPLKVNGLARGSELEDRVAALLADVGLKAADMRRYPHAFSGGQRQRIGIARALSLQPELVIADEPVSALDVSVQSQILNLLASLKDRLGLSYIFITHDLSVLQHISDRVAIMYLGRIVETGPAGQIYHNPLHPYTEALISAVPVADPAVQRKRSRIALTGDVPDPASPPKGCHFHPRCRYATDLCRESEPELKTYPGGVRAACHYSDTLSLQGI